MNQKDLDEWKRSYNGKDVLLIGLIKTMPELVTLPNGSVKSIITLKHKKSFMDEGEYFPKFRKCSKFSSKSQIIIPDWVAKDLIENCKIGIIVSVTGSMKEINREVFVNAGSVTYNFDTPKPKEQIKLTPMKEYVRKVKTKYKQTVDGKEYPVYLIIKDNGSYGLECEQEMYPLLRLSLLNKSVDDYNNGDIK